MRSIYEDLLQLQKSGGEAILVTIVEKEGSGPLPTGAKMLVYPDERTAGTIGGGALERIAIERSAELLRDRQSHLQRYSLLDHHRVTEEEATGMICGGKVTLFYEYISSGTHLYIFGGGHVGQALAYHLRNLPFYVTVIDDRPGVEQRSTACRPGPDRGLRDRAGERTRSGGKLLHHRYPGPRRRLCCAPQVVHRGLETPLRRASFLTYEGHRVCP